MQQKNLAHGITQGLSAQIRGGRFQDGFTGGFTSSLAASYMKQGGDWSDIFQRTAIASLTGGATAHLSGGSFAQGARSAAYVHFFNALDSGKNVDDNPLNISMAGVRHSDNWLENIHMGLDGAGLIPGVGIIPDTLNASIYAFEGDWANAGLSAGAMVPFVGQGVTAGKYGVKSITPKTNPEKFINVRGCKGKKCIDTGEIWERDMKHKDHYEVYKNKKYYDKGIRDRDVWDDGRPKFKVRKR